ncbi:hypothetical protein V1477_018290 [Vespula maculifrons]|uniref:Uncharacterized protein n=1 Tax=Vespula maculifrons TaxID=7453 RepID=A0ABD2AZ06_VESMC
MKVTRQYVMFECLPGVLLPAVASMAGVRAQRGMEDSSRTCIFHLKPMNRPRSSLGCPVPPTAYTLVYSSRSTILSRTCHKSSASLSRRLMAATRESLSTWLLLADVTRLPPIYRSFSRVSGHVLRKKEKKKEEEEEEEEEEEVLPRERLRREDDGLDNDDEDDNDDDIC